MITFANYFKHIKIIHRKMTRIFRKTGVIVCILLLVLCSCNSSKHASKKRRKIAPCDCPRFNYVPQADDAGRTYTFANMQ